MQKDTAAIASKRPSGHVPRMRTHLWRRILIAALVVCPPNTLVNAEPLRRQLGDIKSKDKLRRQRTILLRAFWMTCSVTNGVVNWNSISEREGQLATIKHEDLRLKHFFT